MIGRWRNFGSLGRFKDSTGVATGAGAGWGAGVGVSAGVGAVAVS